MTISAQIVADSISPQGIRLTTMQICLHRYVLAEFNTHRMLSRNFRSSRAVPVKKLISEVRMNPSYPVSWLKNKPGMQATEPMSPQEKDAAAEEWLRGAWHAADHAEKLAELGLHKQWANRGLEPYLYVHGVVTATDFANFYALRRHPDAQPEMKALADAMWEAQQASTPILWNPGQWHLPYVPHWEREEAVESVGQTLGEGNFSSENWELFRKLSVARVARVSYLTHDGKKPSIEEDLALYERLLTSKHMSPFEHQATPDGQFVNNTWANPHLHGNLRGWRQYRKMIPGECMTDGT